MSAPADDGVLAAVLRQLETECGYRREVCRWCSAGGTPQCLACSGRGFFLLPVDDKPKGN